MRRAGGNAPARPSSAHKYFCAFNRFPILRRLIVGKAKGRSCDAFPGANGALRAGEGFELIVRKELADWLDNGARRRATAAAMTTLRREWEAQPAMRSLRAAAAAAGDAPELLLAAATRFFDESGGWSDLLGRMIGEARRDPFFRPPFRMVSSSIHSGLLLLDSPALLVSIGIIPLERLAAKKAGASGGSSIMFNGQWTLLRALKPGGSSFSFWEAPPVGAYLSALDAGRCRLVERRALSEGETILLDGRRQSFVVENAKADLVLLQANVSVGAAPFLAEFDSKTLEFVGASSSDETDSRLELMVRLLRLLDAHEAIPVVRQALASANFHTRWQVMRELLAWDAEAALPVLREMAFADPHAEVRETASETLRLFFTAEEAGAEAECLV